MAPRNKGEASTSKRPLEDGQAPTAARKKAKKDAKSKDARPPASARDVDSSMLPSSSKNNNATARRKQTLDQSVYARGVVSRLQVDVQRSSSSTADDTVSFFVATCSNPEAGPTHDYAELFVILKGAWVRALLEQAGGGLHEHAIIVLAFKEARLAKGTPSTFNAATSTTSASTSATTANANQANFTDSHLIYEKGVECWIAPQDPAADGSTEDGNGGWQNWDKLDWKHFKLFSEAQRALAQSRTAPQAVAPTEAITSTQQLIPGPGLAATPSKAISLAASEKRQASNPVGAFQDQLPNSFLQALMEDDHGDAEDPPTQSTPTAKIASSFPPPPPSPPLSAGPSTSMFAFPPPAQAIPSSTAAMTTQIDQTTASSSEPSVPVEFVQGEEYHEGVALRTETHVYNTVSHVRSIPETGEIVSFMGIVVEDSGPAKRQGNGLSLSLRLVDASAVSGDASKWRSADWLGLTFMNPMERLIPTVLTGDVLLIRGGKTQVYNNKSRVGLFPDQTCDWVVMPIASVTSLPDYGNVPLLAESAFTICQTSRGIDAEERAYMQSLALWSREKQRAANVQANTTVEESHAGLYTDLPPLPESEVQGRLRRLEQLRHMPNMIAQPAFDCYAQVVDVQMTDSEKIVIMICDYTRNLAIACAESANHLGNIESELMLKVLIWKNHTSEEEFNQVAELLHNGNRVLLFKGLEVRLYKGSFNALTRMNKPDFGIEVADKEDAEVKALLQRKASYEQRFRRGPKAYPGVDDSGFADTTGTAALGDRADESIRPKPNTALGGNAQGKFEGIYSTLVASGKLKRLSDLTPVQGTYSPEAFFHCAVEVAAEVEYASYDQKAMLHVVDYTTNELFFPNKICPAYPQDPIVLPIAIFSPQQAAKVTSLRKGDRVLLEHVRIKQDRYNMLEGHVGERNQFRVTRLDKMHPASLAIDATREAYKTTSPQFGGLARVQCKYAGLEVSDIPLEGSQAECEKMYRLRGRVLRSEPADIGQFLVLQCKGCDRYLERDEALCRECDDGVLGHNLISQWCFSLQIELEPKGENIALDAVFEDNSHWVSIMEDAGETVFFNGLDPKVASIAEAKTLLHKLLHNPSEANGTNPIFDFCVKKPQGTDLLMMCDTALVREGKKLPWLE